MFDNSYFVYICTNKYNTVFYTGVTSNLLKRIYQHRNKLIKGFTSKYNVDKLVYFEEYDDIKAAIEREKRLKKWRRSWKMELIKSVNPDLGDLYDSIL